MDKSLCLYWRFPIWDFNACALDAYIYIIALKISAVVRVGLLLHTSDSSLLSLRHYAPRSDWLFSSWHGNQKRLYQTDSPRPHHQQAFELAAVANSFLFSGDTSTAQIAPPCPQGLCRCSSSTSAGRCCTSWTSGCALRTSPLTRRRKVASQLASLAANQQTKHKCHPAAKLCVQFEPRTGWWTHECRCFREGQHWNE